MNLRKILLLLSGSLLMLIWVLSFGESIFKLVSQIFNGEPYYFDNTFLYFLAFALAPFVLNSYMDGMNFVGEVSQKQRMWQKIKFLLLCVFSLLLVFLSIATYFAFFDTFWDEKLSVEFFILLIPISFTLMFLLLVQFLYRSTLKQ
jgi:hypothetical protein